MNKQAELRIASQRGGIRNLIGFVIRREARRRRSGQAVLATVIFLLFASAALLLSFSSIAFRESRSSRIDVRAKQSWFLAEAGMEDLIWRIKNNKQYAASQIITLDGSQATIIVAPSGNNLIIDSTAVVSSATRRARAVLQAGSGASFAYGAQVGDGGLVMENNSRINGSVYSNGHIAGNNEPRITGDAFAAASSAISGMIIGLNAQANRLEDNTIGGSATSSTVIYKGSVGAHGYADAFSGGTIGGNAYYKSFISATTTVNGGRIQIEQPPANLPKINMPISDALIDQWEQEAQAGGIISGPCPYKPADGSTIGPAKINCDVEIDGTNIVTIAGALWVSGSFEMKNQAQLLLASSFGDLSGLVIVDNPSNRTTSSKVEIENTARILGSGQPGSYIMIVSRNTSAESGGGEEAIDVGNSSTAAIYYAPHGLIALQNNVNLKEAASWKMHLKNSAAVTYETGLADVRFSSGPGGGWQIRSWNEVK